MTVTLSPQIGYPTPSQADAATGSAARSTPATRTRPADGTLVAMAKSGFVFFDYLQSKVVPMPEAFSAKFPKVNRLD